MKIYQLVEELRSNNSRLFKESVLEREKENSMLQRVFVAALNPYIQYYIRKIPDYVPSTYENSQSLEWAINELQYLANRTYTGKAGIEHLKNILQNLVEEDSNIIELIIAKDLKCGVSESTVNKIWDNLIPSFPCMLASKYSKKLTDKIFNKSKYAIAQLKSDGLRCEAIVLDNKVTYRSRNGRDIDILGKLDTEILSMQIPSGWKNYVVDGEMLVLDDSGNILSRKEGNGILNKANKGTISEEEASRVIFVVWDIIEYEGFTSGKYEVPYHERFMNLKTSLIHSNKIRLIESQEVKTEDDAREIFNRYLSEGKEGIILKDPDGIWEDKRSAGLIKFKAELECELRVISIIEGTGKYAGMVGALQCESDDGIIKVGVGTGLKDDDRKLPFSHYIGKVVSVKYNEIISNSSGEKSLFLPVFQEVRFDKDTTDGFS